MLNSVQELWYEQAANTYYDFESSAAMPDWIFIPGEQQMYIDRMLGVFI